MKKIGDLSPTQIGMYIIGIGVLIYLLPTILELAVKLITLLAIAILAGILIVLLLKVLGIKIDFGKEFSFPFFRKK